MNLYFALFLFPGYLGLGEISGTKCVFSQPKPAFVASAEHHGFSTSPMSSPRDSKQRSAGYSSLLPCEQVSGPRNFKYDQALEV